MQQAVRCATGRLRLRHFVPALVFLSSLQAETSMLDAIADGHSSGSGVITTGQEMPMPGLALFAFRSWNIAGWKVDYATLFVHVSKGEAPSKIEVATIPTPWLESEPPRLDESKLKFVAHDVSVEPQNWITIQVQPALIEELANAKAHGLILRVRGKHCVFHTRESKSFVPRLFISGDRR
jgi:hypothetical protein